MVGELAIRFLAGGILVCAFAVLGEILEPKSFAGIFGAAPSVALATLGLTLLTHGGAYTSLEGRSMIAGAVALFAFSALAGRLMLRRTLSTLRVTLIAGIAWFAVAFGLWGAVLR